jgi:N6-L-threonylcarbamoyladenine synthase
LKILAADTSCDESCAAIFDTDRWTLLSDVVYSHVDQMKPFGGIVPEVASREHLRGLPRAVAEALKRANLTLTDIDWFTVTNRPGLIGALLVGVSFVKALAFANKKPFSVMNHLEGHLFSALLAFVEDKSKSPPAFPWIAMVVSGGHTELYLVNGPLDYKSLGGTLDDAAGEAFDKIGKILAFEYPAGPQIDRLVREKAKNADRIAYRFPRAKVSGYDFSFSGLKTAVHLAVKKLPMPLAEADQISVAASAQEAILDALVEKFLRAQRDHEVTHGVVTGGVACNSRLREKLPGVFFPAPRHCTDNAAMIAMLSALYFQKGALVSEPWTTTAKPHL